MSWDFHNPHMQFSALGGLSARSPPFLSIPTEINPCFAHPSDVPLFNTRGFCNTSMNCERCLPDSSARCVLANFFSFFVPQGKGDICGFCFWKIVQPGASEGTLWQKGTCLTREQVGVYSIFPQPYNSSVTFSFIFFENSGRIPRPKTPYDERAHPSGRQHIYPIHWNRD